MTNYEIPVGFHFKVEFPSIGNQDMDTRFQSVSGLSVSIQTETIKEGGENRFEHVIPNRTKYQPLILKRGLIADSEVIQWCLSSFQSLEINPVDILVTLLNSDHVALYSWNIVHAWPTKWSVSDFNAEENKLAIETIELNYQYFTAKAN